MITFYQTTNLLRSLALALVINFYLFAKNEQAFIVTPVLDLGQPVHLTLQATGKPYTELPLCWGTVNSMLSCPRIHQLLFNEVVEVIEQKDSSVQIRVPNILYKTAGNNSKNNSYWIEKKACSLYQESCPSQP